jgi:hypothetical protein
MAKIEPLLERVAADQTLPALAREVFGLHAKEYAQLQGQLKEIEGKLIAWRRAQIGAKLKGIIVDRGYLSAMRRIVAPATTRRPSTSSRSISPARNGASPTPSSPPPATTSGDCSPG